MLVTHSRVGQPTPRGPVPRRLTALAATAALAGAVLIPPASIATAAVETCQGRPATIVGTGPAIVGTPGDDVIVSGASRDISADAGHDLICLTPIATGGLGTEVDAGAGDDVVDTTAFGDVARTSLGTGRDRYVGGSGVDSVRADGVNDDVSTGLGSDFVDVTVTSAAPGVRGRYDGGPGPEHEPFTVRGGTLDIELELDGVIAVNGVTLADVSGFHNATVYARSAVLHGNADDNRLYASGCSLRIHGEVGDDNLRIGMPSGREVLAPACESTELETVLSGGRGNDAIDGWSGNDRLFGNAGNDRIRGRRGADVLLGGAGRDHLHGGGGRDVLRGNGANDTLLGSLGRDTADGSVGRDRCVAEFERHCER